MKNRPGSLARFAGYGATIGLLLLAVGTPLAIGGVHLPTIVAAAVVAGLTMAALAIYRGALKNIEVPWFGWLLLGLTGYTVLQGVPLPLGLLRLLAPASVEVLEVSLAGSGGVPAWHPISLDPGATWLEVLKVGTCALAFIAAHNHLRHHERRDRLVAAIVVCGALVTFLGFIGAVALPNRPLMLYVPRAGGGGLIATSFVNPNHGAAFLTICALLATGLAVSIQDLQRRVLLGLTGLLVGAGVFLTLSRAGMAALAVGFAVLSVLLLLRGLRSDDPRRRPTIAIAPALAAATVGVAAWIAYEPILAEFTHKAPTADGSLGKIELWGPGLQMALANPWVGVGRGAFFTAFPRYISGALPSDKTFTHLENQYLHLPAELGLPAALLVIAGSAIALLVWVRRSRSDPIAAGIVGALVAVALHNLFDFNLEMLGIALPLAVLAGGLSAGKQREKRARSSSNHKVHVRGGLRQQLRRVVLAAGILLLPTICLAYISLAPPSANDDLTTLQILARGPEKTAELLREAKAITRRHPADPMPHLVVAHALLQRGDPNGLRWLNRAMYLNPTNPTTHLTAARALIRFGRRRQALLEYRLALEDGAMPHLVFRPALSKARTLEEIIAALPVRPAVRGQAIHHLINNKRAEMALSLAQDARRRWPADVPIARAEITALLATGAVKPAKQIARDLVTRSPSPENYILWGQATRRQNSAEALTILERGTARYPHDYPLAALLTETYLRAKQLDRARKSAERLLTLGRRNKDLAHAHHLLARIHAADGRPHRARFEAERARRLRGM